MEDEDQFIPGIYNYCDRWCERCPMTARCRLFADEQADGAQFPGSRDPENERFWERVKWNLEKTRTLLEGFLENEGIVVGEEDLREADRQEKGRREKVEADPLGQAAEDYAMAVHQWFVEREDLFAAMQEDLNTSVRLALPGDNPAEVAARINEACDVIRWYHFQIAVKVKRALSSRIEDEGDDDLADFPSDADGSAKVALLGVDASLASWGVVREYLEDLESSRTGDSEADVIFDLMLDLDKIRRGIEREFPKVRDFVRPGFDD